MENRIRAGLIAVDEAAGSEAVPVASAASPWYAGIRNYWWVALVAIAVARVAITWWRGLVINRGDFFATMPGAYARELNPTLWNSPDLATSWAYQRDVYLYGPTQYLTLYPVVYWFDSYAEIARFLLFAYALLIGVSAFFLWRTVRLIQPATGRVVVGLFCAVGLFTPLHRAFLQREFEVVVLVLTSAAVFFAASRRQSAAAALMGFAAWFKFFPLVWLPYLVMRRWRTAVLSFVAVSGVVAVLTLALLGSSGLGAVWEVVQVQLEKRTNGAVMCVEWQPLTHYGAVRNSTWADAGWALCSLGDRFAWLPVRAIYVTLVLGLAGLFVAGFIRIERAGPLAEQAEAWRRALEGSLLILASSTLVHAHYYYLCVLIVPLGLLLARYLAAGPAARVKLALWLAAYLLLTAFVIPATFASRLTGFDIWWLYMRHTLYFPGELLLFGLVMWEYLTLAPARAAAVH